MKPIAIFRHSASEGPAYFATYLDQRRLPWQLIKLDEGAAVPAVPTAFAGMALMGGPMSVNDDLPWLSPLLELLREAIARDVPLLGHCLGGQLIAKALGAKVIPNPVKEIGWGQVTVDDNTPAKQWLGVSTAFESFHWHGETFDIPNGATRILGSGYCSNQAFVFGPHLALQCHLEMTSELIAEWARSGAAEIAGNIGASVQTAESMQENIAPRLETLHRMADSIYDKWVEGLRRQ